MLTPFGNIGVGVGQECDEKLSGGPSELQRLEIYTSEAM